MTRAEAIETAKVKIDAIQTSLDTGMAGCRSCAEEELEFLKACLKAMERRK